MTFRIAACQMNSQDDKAANLKTAGRLIAQAADQGAKVVALPEYFNCISTEDEYLANGENVPGPTSEWLQTQAQHHGIYLHGGSLGEAIPGQQKCYNKTLLINPQGEIISQYNKIHLFDIDVKDRVSIKESNTIVSGQEVVTAETEFGCFGLSICYDLRFPELFRAMTLAGARIIFLPAAFTLYTGKDHWEVLLRARAIENEVFIVAPAQIGHHRKADWRTFGSTMIINPWGTVVARAEEETTVIVAEIDYAYQDRVRAGLPCLEHRRPDIYKQTQ